MKQDSPKVNCVNPIFKFISEALFMTKKHEKVIRKILAAHLKQNWKRLNPHWMISGGNQLASKFCELISSGHCDYELAAHVASDLFGRKIVCMPKDNRGSKTYGESTIVNPIYISTSKLEIWKNVSNSVENEVPIEGNKMEKFGSSVSGNSGMCDSKMATGDRPDHMASTGSTRTACRRPFDEASKMAAPIADDAQRGPLSDARQLTPAKQTKTNSGAWRDASAEICCTATTARARAIPEKIQETSHHFWNENFDTTIEGNPDDPSLSRGARKDWWPGGARRKVFGAPPHLCPRGAPSAALETLVHPSKFTREEETTPWRRPSDSSSQGDQREGRCVQHYAPRNGNDVTTATPQNSTSALEEIRREETNDGFDSLNELMKEMRNYNCKCGKQKLTKHTWIIHAFHNFEEGVHKAKELLEKIFESDDPDTWDDHCLWENSEGKLFDWHTLHMLDFDYWGDKTLVQLIPHVLKGRRTKNIEKCSKRFEKHKNRIWKRL